MECFFSFIIASKNEAHDIGNVIESCFEQTIKNFEVLIIDDSTDKTRDVIKEYNFKNLHLIEGKKEGCCNARNLGIQLSKGNVIVFLTDDTILPKYYLEQIAQHYEEGYDWVTVSAEVQNLNFIFPKFIEAQHKFDESKINYDPYTTQGYSVKKSSALEVGLISGNVYPFNFCRDWTLGQKLTKNNYRKMHDPAIKVYHNSPYKLNDYWTVRKTRGLMSAYQPYYLFNKSIKYLFFKFISKSIISFFKVLLLIPFMFQLYKISKFSDKKLINIINFIPPFVIQEYAFRYGELKGLINIVNNKNK